MSVTRWKKEEGQLAGNGSGDSWRLSSASSNQLAIWPIANKVKRISWNIFFLLTGPDRFQIWRWRILTPNLMWNLHVYICRCDSFMSTHQTNRNDFGWKKLWDTDHLAIEDAMNLHWKSDWVTAVLSRVTVETLWRKLFSLHSNVALGAGKWRYWPLYYRGI